MAKSKFTLSINPTFKAKVDIPIPGKQPEAVEFTFKGRTRDEFLEFLDTVKTGDKSDAELVMDITSGWELEDEFCKENIELMCQNYLSASTAVFNKYLSEINKARLGN